jgi:5-oxoprolinase (ATP-hydrolysing)
VAQASGVRYALVELAESLLQIANANMVQAIRTVSIAKGCDPRDYVLVPFGGAAGQHACAIAAELGTREILHHPNAGLLSAYGIGLADHTRHRSARVGRPHAPTAIPQMREAFDRLEAEARNELASDFPAAEKTSQQSTVVSRLDLRYQGLDAYLTIDQPPDGGYVAAFEAEHRKLYGYVHADRPLEIVAARVEVSCHSDQRSLPSKRVAAPSDGPEPPVAKSQTAYFGGRPLATKIYNRNDLRPGHSMIGPAIIHESASTTVIDPGWHGEVLSGGEILVNAEDGTGWSSRFSVSAQSESSRQNSPKAELQPATSRAAPWSTGRRTAS